MVKESSIIMFLVCLVFIIILTYVITYPINKAIKECEKINYDGSIVQINTIYGKPMTAKCNIGDESDIAFRAIIRSLHFDGEDFINSKKEAGG